MKKENKKPPPHLNERVISHSCILQLLEKPWGKGIYMEDKLIVLNKLMLDCELNGVSSDS